MPVFSLTNPYFWLQFLYFIPVVFFFYYIPGTLLLRDKPFGKAINVALSVAIGISVFAVVGFIAGYLRIHFLLQIYLFFCNAVWAYSLWKRKIYPAVNVKFDWKPLSIIIAGTLLQLSTIWFTGILVHGTAFYCCGNANDNFFYGSLSQSITHSVPPENPGMTGYEFKNYHYWSNLVVGETARISSIPVFQLQFQYSTVLIAVLSGILLFGLIAEFGGSKRLGMWTLFFFYFGSDAVYWLILVLHSAPMFSMSSLEDGAGFLANYPRAMAIMISFAAVLLLFRLRKRFNTGMFAAVVMLMVSIAGMKIYVAFFIYSGLIFLALYDYIYRKSKVSSAVGFMTLVAVAPLYLLTNSGAGGVYFLGFWRAQNFIVQPWLNLLRLEQARIIYAADKKWIQVLCFNLLFTVTYTVAIFGTKIIGLVNSRKSLRQLPGALHIFLIPAIIISFALGFFYNQDTGESNTFNFLVSVFIYASVYAALAANYLSGIKTHKAGIVIGLGIIILTVPRPLFRLYRNIADITGNKSFHISSNILAGAEFIRSATGPRDVFLVNSKIFKFDTEGPVFSILTDRPMYYSGEQFLSWFKADPVEMEKRKQVLTAIFTSPDIRTVAASLKDSGIAYIIDAPATRMGATLSASFLEPVYENYDLRVLKVLPENLRTE